MAFQDTNVSLGLPELDAFQVGRSHEETNDFPERNADLPFADEEANWLYYECIIRVVLDSGIVVHHCLPQVDRTPDTLTSSYLTDDNLDIVTDKGVNLKSSDQYQDIVQRMGHSRYWFHLWGQALRVGEKVPIPGIKTVGGVPVIPYDKNPQWAYNSIVSGANYSGGVIWKAQWSLWYTTVIPPVSQDIPVIDLVGRTTDSTPLPKSMQSPYSVPDDNAQSTTPPSKLI